MERTDECSTLIFIKIKQAHIHFPPSSLPGAVTEHTTPAARATPPTDANEMEQQQRIMASTAQAHSDNNRSMAPPPPAAAAAADDGFPTAADLARATATHRQGAFVIASRKLPISRAGPIARLEASLGIPVPEMIFGDNAVRVAHEPTGWAVEFNARDALDAVDKTGANMLQVAHARSWTASREKGGEALVGAARFEVVRPFDWSYSTAYRGTVVDVDGAGAGTGDGERGRRKKEFAYSEGATKPIPLALLRRRDPILFFDEVVLYESELDDNGVSALSVKVRVHERRMLLLARLFMRLDGVLVRVRDTRVYVDFEAEEVTREYTAREGGFEDTKRALLMTGLRPDEITVALRDANRLSELLPIVEQTLESVSLKP
ncbi:hypothetical protein DL766_000217 [Monosporascus sp. MC13-8B]|uniref:TIP41-like protein n=1 Tax=Monosporascus cannonballus TaxID=155416 RepID=A0ABY0H279_9PEZI|nr:hypothetical protein DL762_006523 [Monosporascus cannonballus]RYO83769.1 hypothetical protein DL763_007732 [Monosporascus cannonballus]RYP39775.1 hypothetical protein DL766_000217 [Monosporascus sp. MC13-8B]